MLRYLLLPALLASSPSDADTCICNHAPPATQPTATKGCKLVVRDFDGPQKLADASHSVFMTGLGKYTVIPTKKWDVEFADTGHHGPLRWQAAAKRTGAEAVVEGWIQDEGRRHTLTVLVRDAGTGNEIDSVSVKVNDNGVAQDPAHLMEELDEILQWVDCTPKRALIVE